MRNRKSRQFRKLLRENEIKEIGILNSWIESQKPDSGSNPISLPPLPKDAPIGRLSEDQNGVIFSRYAGVTKFYQLPLSEKTKRGLKEAKYSDMTDIQRASLPHALCGRDILGAAKTGSGKTLAFVIPVLEKLHKERWGLEDGVGCIIISPTRELACQLFNVLKAVGKHHNFSAGLLIGGRDVDTEKQRVNELNVLVCTPGRLLQHMDETPNFECTQLQILVLDEADRILDAGFKKQMNAIISQLPKHRQTLLFSATQTKSIKDLARLSLKDPEYICVHDEAVTATPDSLRQTAIIVQLDKKLDMLWSFLKAHLNSKILVFLTTKKQVKFVFETFKKLRPGIPLNCLYGDKNPEKRIGVYSQFCERKHAVLFSTDVAARGLDFNKAVDWVVQVDCPEDVACYIHRVGRTARYMSGGRSVLFLMPSEIKMLEKLKEAKVPISSTKPNNKRLLAVSGLMSALLVKYPNFQALAQRAFITYLRSIHKRSDKETFDVTKLPVDEFSASLGLPMTPKIRFLSHKTKSKKGSDFDVGPETVQENSSNQKEELLPEDTDFDKVDKDFIMEDHPDEVVKAIEAGDDTTTVTRVPKKKKLKINVHRPLGTRVVFDEEGNTLPPLATVADRESNDVVLDRDKKDEYYRKMREELNQVDKEDKLLDRQKRREKRIRSKMKLKKMKLEEGDGEDEDEDGLSESDEEVARNRKRTKTKIYFDSDSDAGVEEQSKDKAEVDPGSISITEQEELALELLSSMKS